MVGGAAKLETGCGSASDRVSSDSPTLIVLICLSETMGTQAVSELQKPAGNHLQNVDLWVH
jgi:hypothetical protein